MVKRICVLYPDGSLNVLSGNRGEQHLNEARAEERGYNKGETRQDEKALVGEIDVDLMSFKERC